MNSFNVPYATWAALAAATSALLRKVYYMPLGAGYMAIGGNGTTFVTAQITEAADIAAFEASYKGSAIVVASESDAYAQAIAPPFTA